VLADARGPEVTDSQHIEHAEQHDQGKADAERVVVAGRQPSVVEKQRQKTVDDDEDKMLCGTFDDGVCTMRAAVVEPHRRHLTSYTSCYLLYSVWQPSVTDR